MALDRKGIIPHLRDNARILITGGSGTLGHAIVSFAEQQKWNSTFTIYARSELKLAMMQRRFPQIRTIIGDVRDYDHLAASIAGHDGVIHGAAMKRIPECEEQPRECILTNVIGSENVARACLGQVSWVVGISTDKACQASTTYGGSKLLLESIFQSYANKRSETDYLLVRYGNVVASNGSVLPLWEKLYKAGLPLPITDCDMTRFWMSPYDAVNTISYALDLFDSERPKLPGIFVPKVAACNMMELAMDLYPDCIFQEVGLRSNEKLHESLVSSDEVATEWDEGFLIGRGSRGKSYTSQSAPRLERADFDRMRKEAVMVEP